MSRRNPFLFVLGAPAASHREPAPVGSFAPATSLHWHSFRRFAIQVLTALLAPGLLWADWETEHSPEAPRTGETVTVTVRTVGPPYPEHLWLHYQVVEPGHYIALQDDDFLSQWESLPMSDLGLHGDASAGDGRFTARLGPEIQRHRRLIRYHVSASADPDLGFKSTPAHRAYFVYDGVPAWRGAINPQSAQDRLSQKQIFPSSALTRLPVYHLISKREWIEGATWAPTGRSFRYGGDNSYHYTGTLVYDGQVYDHIEFRARGGVWRHAMGKNMWKINFRKRQPFHAKDNLGRAYVAPWDKLNLGAGIQQGQYGLRGEHGMFDALSYRLFNLAGTPAPNTHWVHFRIVDNVHEATSNQFEGDFWGLYLAVENIDASFVKQHRLPQGNLYKIEQSSPFPRYIGCPSVHPPSEAYGFLMGPTRGRPNDQWWMQHVELDAYYRYRSIVECVHHYDIAQGKNYFFYYDGSNSRWTTIPWDVDLTWGEHMYGSGRDPFLAAGILRDSQRHHAYLSQPSDCRDLLFNENEMNRLIDDLAALIDPPSESLSIVDADRAMWDYHPVMSSRYSMRHQAGQGKYYFGNPSGTFEVMVEYLKEFVRTRSKWIDQALLRDHRPLPTPNIVRRETAEGIQLLAGGKGATDGRYRWRVAPIRRQDPGKGIPALYEIEGNAILHDSGATLSLRDLTLPAETCRVRLKRIAPDGRTSRWSDALELPPGSLTTPSSR